MEALVKLLDTTRIVDHDSMVTDLKRGPLRRILLKSVGRLTDKYIERMRRKEVECDLDEDAQARVDKVMAYKEGINRAYAVHLMQVHASDPGYACRRLLRTFAPPFARDYRMTAVLGAGRYGTVCQAMRVTSAKGGVPSYLNADLSSTPPQLAIKIALHSGDDWMSLSEEIALQNVFAEHGLAPRLLSPVHDHVVGSHRVSCFAMEQVDFTLQQALYRRTSQGHTTDVNSKQALVATLDGVLGLMDRMHSVGLIHGDFHPENIAFLQCDRTVCWGVIDTGIASNRFLRAPGSRSKQIQEEQFSQSVIVDALQLLRTLYMAVIEILESLESDLHRTDEEESDSLRVNTLKFVNRAIPFWDAFIHMFDRACMKRYSSRWQVRLDKWDRPRHTAKDALFNDATDVQSYIEHAQDCFEVVDNVYEVVLRHTYERSVGFWAGGRRMLEPMS